MNAERLLEHFDRIADAPDAVPRLRQFILDLAVRGKLVEQDPNDEPASELFKRMQGEKARLVKEGKIRGKESQRFLSNEDDRFSIPNTWAWTRLGEIGDWGSGSTPSRGKQEFFGGNVSWLKSGELNDNEALVGSEETLTELALTTCSFRVNKPGDILFAMYGATIGKVAILAGHAVTNQAVVGCSPFSGVFNRYLFKFLISQREKFRTASEGGAQPNVSKQKVVRCPFPLPPLAEQQRIVAKVDELMGLCDRLEAAQREREGRRDRLTARALDRLNGVSAAASASSRSPDGRPSRHTAATFVLDHLPRLATRPEHIHQLRQTILNLAVRGQLVPQDPNDKSASELYQRLTSCVTDVNEQNGSRRRKDVDSSKADVFGEYVFPESWIVTNFDTMNFIVSGVAKGKDLRGLRTATYPYLRVANVQRGYLDLSLVKEIEISVDEFDRYCLQSGDVLMTEGGDWDKLGRAAIWNDEVPSCIHQNHIYRIRSANKDELLPEWIALFANSHLGRSYFESASKQTTNLASINMTQLRSCPLPLPPTAEQHRIVAKVNELMALCDRLEAQLTAAQTDSRRLLEALLHEALAPAAELV